MDRFPATVAATGLLGQVLGPIDRLSQEYVLWMSPFGNFHL
jgi:hypothetical protein